MDRAGSRLKKLSINRVGPDQNFVPKSRYFWPKLAGPKNKLKSHFDLSKARPNQKNRSNRADRGPKNSAQNRGVLSQND